MRAMLKFAGPLLALVPGVSMAEEKEGMPQLDPHSYASQLFWLAVFFVLIFAFLRFVGLPRVIAILEDRRHRIGSEIATAEQLRTKATEAQAAYEAAMAKAHGEARQLLSTAHERNIATLTQQTKAATASFDVKVDDAVKRIAEAQAVALQGIHDVARSLASEITVKLSGRSPSAESLTRAIQAAAGQEAA